MEEKSPVVATFLSILFPGLGSIYAGKAPKGVALMSVFVYTLYALGNGAEGWLFLVVFWVFAAIEAYRDAEGGEKVKMSKLGWGIFWVVVGFLLQLHVLGYLRLGVLLRYWPTLVILGGFYLIVKAFSKEEENEKG